MRQLKSQTENLIFTYSLDFFLFMEFSHYNKTRMVLWLHMEILGFEKKIFLNVLQRAFTMVASISNSREKRYREALLKLYSLHLEELVF